MNTPSERSSPEPGRPALRTGIGKRVGDTLRRITFERSFTPRTCTHPADDVLAPVPALSCPSCASEGIEWLKLRMCLTCGSVGCCDSSAGRHAASHFDRTGHPLMRSIEPGETWGWCYVDQAYLRFRDA
jgi:CPA1 family monovalent cation:H+ antiporter